MSSLRQLIVTTTLVFAAMPSLLSCRSESQNNGDSAAAPAASALVQSSCSGLPLREKDYYLTVRTATSEDVFANGAKLENVPRPVFFDEIVLEGRSYLGLSVPVPENAPLGQPLQITLLAADRGLLPTCLAQVSRTLAADNERILVTELLEIPPSLGLWPQGAQPDFEAACVEKYQMNLHVTDSPTEKLQGSVCYSGSDIQLKYDVSSDVLEWTSSNPNVVTVSNDGLVTARTNGQVPVSARLRNASGAVGVGVNGGGTLGLSVVSMSNVDLQEGSGGIKQSAFTIQLTTPDGVPLNVPLLVEYSTQSGTAVAGSDYCASELCNTGDELLGFATIAPGQLKSDPIRFFVNGDNVPEPDERFFVNLTAQFATANPNKAQIKLLNDDGPVSKVFAKGVGFENRTTGQITIRPPAPGDSAYVVWNQQDAEMSEISIANDSLQTTATLRKRDLVSASRPGVDDYSEYCFVAPLPKELYATTTVPSVATFTLRSTRILDGIGVIVVAGLTAKSHTSRMTGELSTYASFSDQQSDIVSHSVELKAGCDFFYYNAPGHANSQVVSFPVNAAAEDRSAKLTFMAADGGPDRGSEVLYWAGSSGKTIPKTLSDAPSCEPGKIATGCVTLIASDFIPGRPALIGNNGQAWDTFGQYSGAAPGQGAPQTHPDPDLRGVITIPAGATTASFQLMSPRKRKGESATLLLMGLEVLPPQAQ